MSDFEDERRGGWSLLRLATVSFIIAAIGCAPLEFEIAFGPADGNPVGYGLLAVLGIFLGLVVFVGGLIKRLIRHLR